MSDLKHFVNVETSVVTIKEDGEKTDVCVVFPEYIMSGKDLMKKGGKFYAVLDRHTGMWVTDDSEVYRIIDEDIMNYISTHFAVDGYGVWRNEKGLRVLPQFVDKSETTRLRKYKQWFSDLPDNHNYIQLDQELTFKSDVVEPTDYRSLRLPYDVCEGDLVAYERLMTTLYDETNRKKLEWAVGSVLAGESKRIDKMIAIYSYPGFGKSTVLDIIKQLFGGVVYSSGTCYWAPFVAEDLADSKKQFATAAFKDNPLLAIQDDGKLSSINSPTINELISHSVVLINEKNKSQYPIKSNAMLFVATNETIDLHDTKAGIVRRLLDVYPTRRKLPVDEYRRVVKAIEFEIGAIAYHCLGVYKSAGRDAYEGYSPIEMIRKTNYLQNFLFDKLDELSKQEHLYRDTLYLQYKQYYEDSGLGYPPKRITFGEQLREYFNEYEDVKWIDGKTRRHVYTGLKIGKITGLEDLPPVSNEPETWIELKEQFSPFDALYSECVAQYATDEGNPQRKWINVTSKLKDIDTKKLHWLKLPENVIKIDFDKRGKDGEKSLEENIKAASVFPPTYCEVSKSGQGLHLYYIWDGNVDELSNIYEENVEIKKSVGNMAHRRILTKCNDLPVAKIGSGLPLKGGGKKVVSQEVVTTVKGLRTTIKKCLAKEVHADTRSNIDFIFQVLEDAYNSGLEYDVSDQYVPVLLFAYKSTHQSEYCVDKVRQMKFKSATSEDVKAEKEEVGEGPVIIFDIEVFPDLFLICWSYEDDDAPVVTMINPSPEEVADLFGVGKAVKPRMVGFNNRSYDNHICYGRIVGDSVNECYLRSRNIIDFKNNNAKFGEAYNLSYTDIYDFSSKKQSLKKWEIELGIHHQESGFPWDEPVGKENFDKVADYCINDVKATKAVWKHLQGDFAVRQLLAELSGLTPNDTNRAHITKILLGDKKRANSVYTDIATGVGLDMNDIPVPNYDPNVINSFPGYECVRGEDGKLHNMYLGTDLGFGGYVYAEPGIYVDVAQLDVGNMYGKTIILLNKLGEDTKNYVAIREARMAIKHKDYEKLKTLFDGKLLKYLENDEMADRVQTTMKLILNSTYGIIEATFDNPLKDPRDKNNTIAVRGSCFMRKLQKAVEDKGFKVIHIKTDSIKVPNATQDIIDFIIEFGAAHGYEFEHECTYDRIALVNDAVYIAKYDDKGIRNKGGKKAGQWTATGAQFQQPYIFKTLFSKEPLTFEDKCETKSCSTAFYLDFNEELPEGEHDYRFVGRVGEFCPIKPGCGGGLLFRKKDDKYYAATGTTGYRWLESEVVRNLGKENDIDETYYADLVDRAIDDIGKYGDFWQFVNGDPSAESYLFDID